MPDSEENRIKQILGKLGSGPADRVKYSDWNLQRQARKEEKEREKQRLRQEHLQAQAEFNRMKAAGEVSHPELYEAKQRARAAKAALNQTNPWKKPFSVAHQGVSGLMTGMAIGPGNTGRVNSGKASYSSQWEDTREFLLFLVAIVAHVLDFFMGFSRTPEQWLVLGTFYVFLCMMCAASLKDRGEHFLERFGKFLGLAVAALILPFFVKMLTNLPFINAFEVGNFSVLDLVFIIIAAFPVFVIGGFFNSPGTAGKWTRAYLYIWIIGTILFYFYSVSADLPVMGSAIDRAGTWDNMKEFWGTVWENVRKATLKTPDTIWKGINSSVNLLYEPYFVSEVEESKSDKLLGVYIKNLEPATDPVLPEEQKIVVYADLQAKTFVGEVDIRNACYGKYEVKTPDHKTAFGVVEGSVNPPRLGIADFEENSLICTIDRNRIQTGRGELQEDFEVSFNSTFTFTTWGYVTYAFMEQQELRNRRKSGEDIARELGISETVKAVYTNGPVMLGMVREQDPPKLPFGINPETRILPVFGVTIENTKAYTGRGEIERINRMVFHIPKPLRLDPETCYPDQYTQEREVDKFTLYTFTNIPVRQDLGYQSTKCRLMLEPGMLDELLGEGGISLATLAVEVDYDYQLSESTRITLEKPAPENPT